MSNLKFGAILATAALAVSGCMSPAEYRTDMDRRALEIIKETQAKVTETPEMFAVQPCGDTLRRRLLEAGLPTAGNASFGTDRLLTVQHWPEPGFPEPVHVTAVNLSTPLSMSLMQALEVGAQNSPELQSRKEAVFQAALDLDLERDAFRNAFTAQIESLAQNDTRSDPHQGGGVQSLDTSVVRVLENGMTLSAALAVDLATLLNGGSTSSAGIMGNASITLPLLRGSGKHIRTENLQQAERNVLYALREYERFKRVFAVDIGRRYLTLLKLLDIIKNNEDDYESRRVSARRSKRLADAGRIKEIEVDQAFQNELNARQRWISSKQAYQSQLDSFKTLIGLPTDSLIELDTDELKRLVRPSLAAVEASDISPAAGLRMPSSPLGASPVLMAEPMPVPAGPLELNQRNAVNVGLKNRLDMAAALDRVIDAQRGVVVAADALGAEVTLFGSADVGERRTVSTAGLDDARLDTGRGLFSALVSVDLPFERSKEAAAYRNSYILLEQTVRALQSLEDTIKLDIRNRLRSLKEARESLVIQTKAVEVAKKRVKSTTLFMEAGRAETRDLLEAQDALLSAQNDVTAARVNYRIAELELQRDMGVLTVTEKGLWKEYQPEKTTDVEN